jgi:N-acetylglucosaminyldiphosphoundecaprenol N-acetyl-beta-D-mannosaminyltransferase
MTMPIDAVTRDEAVELVCARIAVGRGGTVLTPNVDILRQFLASEHLRAVFEHTDLRVADGMPLVIALRLQRTPVPERITGTDLLWALCAGAADAGLAVLLAGGLPGDAARAADRLTDQLPNLKVQTHPCFVRPETEAAELAELKRVVVEANPDIVFIGLPFGTQVAVMGELSRGLPATWFVGVGSTFELINGDRSRPPRWLQRLCLEWAWRLTRQPGVWRRYLVQGMPIAARLGVSALRVRWRRP